MCTLDAQHGSPGEVPATCGCPEVAQVINKAVGSSLKALGVSFGPHLPALALSEASGKWAQHSRARARSRADSELTQRAISATCVGPELAWLSLPRRRQKEKVLALKRPSRYSNPGDLVTTEHSSHACGLVSAYGISTRHELYRLVDRVHICIPKVCRLSVRESQLVSLDTANLEGHGEAFSRQEYRGRFFERNASRDT